MSQVQKNECLAIIPARYASSRFPGKPLAMLGGKTILERVINQVKKSGVKTVVATDDIRIMKTVEHLGVEAVMTRERHKSGTDRIEEAAEILKTDAKVIINVQGDEPFVRPEQIESLINCFSSPEIEIATLARHFDSKRNFQDLSDPNLVKVTFNNRRKALYFSRSVIPYLRNVNKDAWPEKHEYFTHVGLYAFRRETLREVTKIPASSLEMAESLEQLRWLQAGYEIAVAITSFETIGIDTPQDLIQAEQFLTINREIFREA